VQPALEAGFFIAGLLALQPKETAMTARATMRKIAVFGNAGGGKSRLASRLAEATSLPLYCLDVIQFRAGRYWLEERGGGKISDDEYLKIHSDIIKRDEWIIDGYGSVASAWERFAVADTLVYIDLPLLTHYRWVTSRLAKGLFRNPPGWPENSPVWASTLDSYRVVRLCHRLLTPRYRQLVADASSCKRVHHLKSASEIEAFLEAVRQEHRRT
jgi:adenylate kinase family enzyme